MDIRSRRHGIPMKVAGVAAALFFAWPMQVLAYKVVSDVTAQWCFAQNGDVWIGDDERSHGDCIMERIRPGSTLADVVASADATSRQTPPRVDCKVSGYCTVRMPDGTTQAIKVDEMGSVKLDAGESAKSIIRNAKDPR